MDVIITPQAAADAGCSAVVTKYGYSDSSTTLSGEKRTFSGSFSSIALNVAKGWKPAQLYVNTTQTINDHETVSETKYLRAGNLYLERYGNAIDLKTAYVDFDGRFPLAELNPLPAIPEGIQRWVYDDGTFRRSVQNVITEIEIRFDVDQVSISTSASPADAGTTTGGGLYSPGSSVTIEATPNEGYVFQRWTKGGNVVSNNSTYSFTASEDATYVAEFHEASRKYIIKTSADPVQGGVTSGDGRYSRGETVRLDAVANPGYKFYVWKKGVLVVAGGSGAYAFAAKEDAEYVAVFKPCGIIYYPSSGKIMYDANAGNILCYT